MVVVVDAEVMVDVVEYVAVDVVEVCIGIVVVEEDDVGVQSTISKSL